MKAKIGAPSSPRSAPAAQPSPVNAGPRRARIVCRSPNHGRNRARSTPFGITTIRSAFPGQRASSSSRTISDTHTTRPAPPFISWPSSSTKARCRPCGAACLGKSSRRIGPKALARAATRAVSVAWCAPPCGQNRLTRLRCRAPTVRSQPSSAARACSARAKRRSRAPRGNNRASPRAPPTLSTATRAFGCSPRAATATTSWPIATRCSANAAIAASAPPRPGNQRSIRNPIRTRPQPSPKGAAPSASQLSMRARIASRTRAKFA